MLNYKALTDTAHYDYFFRTDGSIKTDEYLGGYASLMVKLGRAYIDAYGKADESNLYAMRSALTCTGQTHNDLHRYLLFCYNDMPSQHMPIFVALLLLGYNANAVLNAITTKQEN
jgi:hypothetical protein